MRIYSNTLLSWPQVLHVFQAARLYPGQWHQYYFYKIKCVDPLVLTTNSPLELLQENCQYYCYDRYYRDPRLEPYGNSFTMLHLAGKKPDFGIETWGNVPKTVTRGDIIAVIPAPAPATTSPLQ